MNEMRKLMEAVNTIDIEIGDEYVHLESGAVVTVYDILRGGAYIEVKTGQPGKIYTFTPEELGDQFTKSTLEANQGGKTEHSGAKHGKGAYYGRKKDAKQDSKKNRRNADKAETQKINEYEDFGFTEADDLYSSFEEELDTLLNNYWSNAEHVDVGSVEAHKRLELILRSFVGKD